MTVSDKTTPTTSPTPTPPHTPHRMSDDDETWLSEDRIYDYLTILGLNTKFGLNGKDYDCFTIQQVIDNALDFIEQNSKKFVNGQIPFVSVIITEIEDKVEHGGGKVTQVSIRNSNAGIRRGRNFTFFLPRLQKSTIDPPLNLKILEIKR
jgi:hypothetical protein